MSSLLDSVLLAWLISRRFGERRLLLEEETRRNRRTSVRPVTSQPDRQGHFHGLYANLRQHPEKFASFCGLSVSTFDRLLEELRPGLTYRDTDTSQGIAPEEQLIVTLRFLTTGNSFRSLHFEFLLETSAIVEIICLSCEVIWQRLEQSVMPQPTAQQWLDIAKGFLTNAKFPNCIGALNGKHIRVKKPLHSGSRFYNYESNYSVVIWALADSNYCFIIADIESYESTDDSHIFRASRMGQLLLSDQLALPEPRVLPGSSSPPAPFVIVGDEGIGLTTHVMRPFPPRGLDTRKRIFNYRLTKARRFVQCAFGILTSKWRVFLRTIQMDPDSVNSVIKACMVLHNFSRIYDTSMDAVEDQLQTTSPMTVDQTPTGTSGVDVRDLFADYFLTPEGSVPRQMDNIE